MEGETDATSIKREPTNDDDSNTNEKTEPKFKYIRMGNDVKEILINDAFSCVAIHPKFVCVGTKWGIIHLLDHDGNNVNKELRAHSVAINQISIDANGDYIASCSDDGRVFVFGLYSSENNRDLTMERLVRSVAIDPFYYKPGSGRRFITGDEKLVLHEKTFFSRLKQTVLGDASFEGGVKTMKWSPSGDLLAWASHVGFRVYDLTNRTPLGMIKWTSKHDVDLKCHICWKDSSSVIVGWAKTIRVCAIKRKTVMSQTDFSPFFIELSYTIQVDCTVCGVGPLDGNLVILGCAETANGTRITEEPQLRVLQPHSNGYSGLGIDFLPLRNYQEYPPSHFSLDCLSDEGRFVIVSPRDIVVAIPTDQDDRIDWLLENLKFQAALDAIAASDKKLARHSRFSVGRAYIDYLLNQKQYLEAAQLCPKILGADKVKWEVELRKFALLRQLRVLADYLPTSHDGALPPHNYEIVLYEYLSLDREGFLQKLKSWPPRLFNVPAVANATMDRLKSSGSDLKSNAVLLEALAVLYSHMGKHDKALSMYIKLQNKGVFELIRQHNLFWMVHTTVKDLMKLDTNRAVELMLEKYKAKDNEVSLVKSDKSDADLQENKFKVKPQDIVDALKDKKDYLYIYLDALDNEDTRACQKYHSLLVKFYAEYQKDKLLNLLKKSDHYAIQEALEICRNKKYYAAMVHLLGRIGNTKEALVLILCQLKDIEKAIDFCKEHDDQDLWNDLINFSLDKPEYVTILLKRIGTYVDPRILVQKIQNTTKIPHLKGALVKMMLDYNLQVQFQENCNQIISDDYFDLQERLATVRQRGLAIREEQYCSVCNRKFITSSTKDGTEPSSVVVFHCCHIFHVECVPGDPMNCTICSTTQKHLSAL